MEIWKTIDDFSNYEISSYGSVRNKTTGKVSKLTSTDRSGFYRKKLISDEGKSLTRAIHKLVAEAFLDNPHDHRYVIPMDGNKLNVRVENLKWGTLSEFYKVFPKKPRKKELVVFDTNKILPGEEWKDIPDTGGYKISNIGRYFDPYMGIKSPVMRDKLMYMYINKGNAVSTRRIHKIIADSFIKKDNDKKHLIFIDSDTTNVNYRNLKWVTWDEKQKHERKLTSVAMSHETSESTNVDPMLCEVWKTILPHDNYEISSFGRIRNKITGHYKIPTKNSDGRYNVTLWKNNKGSRLSLKRLVAKYFLPNETRKTFLVHINGDKSDYRLSNLAYSDITKTRNIRIDDKIEQRDEYGLVNVWDSFKDVLSAMNITYIELNEACQENKLLWGSYWKIYVEVDMDGEIWKEYRIQNGLYEVSNKGRVRNGHTKRHLSLHVNEDGYVSVGLKGKKTYFVHRLVGTLFVNQNMVTHNEINHIDGDKQNNASENLEWCTRKQNQNHASRTGLNNPKRRSKRKVVNYVDGEIWRDIPSHPGYRISNFSRISKDGYLVSQHYYVYKRVKLNGKNFQVHRLTATTFLPNPDNLPVVNHKDGNKVNNSLDNLEWVSYSENTQHANDTGLIKYTKAQKINQYNLDGDYMKTWDSISSAARATNISKHSIIKCLKGIFSTAGSYRWEYNDK